MTPSPAPTQVRPDPARPGWTVGTLLVVAGLWAFAVTQPLLAMLGAEPAFFLVRRASAPAVVVFAIGLATVGPLLLWGLGLAADRIDVHLGRWYLRGLLAVIVAVALAPLIDATGIEPVLGRAVAAGAGIGFVVAYERFDAVALWARFTAVLPVISVAAFLLASPTSALLHRSTGSSVDQTARGTEPSVLFLLLDELPTASLLDADGAIDAGRFPNLARLAGDGTWYRNHTAAATTTAQAIPAILTGNGPVDGPPLAASYPDNLFTLLSSTHRLHVSESVTAMCPTRLCDEDRSPALVNQVGGLTADTTGLLLDRIGHRPSSTPTMDEFAETLETLTADEVFGELVSAPTRFTEFVDGLEHAPVAAPPTDDPFAGQPPAVEPVETVEPVAAVPVSLAGDADPVPAPDTGDDTDGGGDGDRDAGRLDERPTLSYLHLLLPHGPWRLYPDGQPYATTSYPVGDYDDTSDAEWVKAMFQQRHLLQAQYADHLVGEILGTLEAAGTYDDTLIVTMADHGVAFRHGSDARLWDAATASQIAYSPLIIKAPGQTLGVVDDANVTSLDVLPTVVDLLDVRVPWSIAGAPVGSDEVRARGDDKRIVDRGDWSGPTQRHEHDFAMSETTPTALGRWIPPTSPDDERSGGLLAGLLGPLDVASFLGRPIDEVVTDTEARATVTLTPPAPAAEPEGLVRGLVVGAPADARILIAVDGRIVTAAPTIVLDDEPGTFLALLPPEALLAAIDRSTIELALVSGTGADVQVQRALVVP